MRERPILFSTPMVKAILEGRKTQTRRIVKEQPGYPDMFAILRKQWNQETGCMDFWNVGAELRGHYWRCPYGKPGDQLWVRETYLRPGDSCLMEWGEYEWYWTGFNKESIVYCADGVEKPFRAENGNWLRKMPSIHMPRWASRIQLEVVSVRVERLQDIGAIDAVLEGYPYGMDDSEHDPVEWYRDLWESINGKGSWDSNPFVWVIEFKQVSK